jgi:hypothetical protein
MTPANRSEESKARQALADIVSRALQIVDLVARPEVQAIVQGDSPLARAALEPVLSRADDPLRRMLTTTVPAAMALHSIADHLRALGAIVMHCATALPLETVCRSVVESAAVVMWVVEPGISAKKRRARAHLLAWSSRFEGARAAREAGEAKPLPRLTFEDLRARCTKDGLRLVKDNQERSVKYQPIIEGEGLPRFTERSAALLKVINARGAYHVYAGVTHAELYGLFRAFGDPFMAGDVEMMPLVFHLDTASRAIGVGYRSALEAARQYSDWLGLDAAPISGSTPWRCFTSARFE